MGRSAYDSPLAAEQQPHQARLFRRIVWIQIVGFTLFNLLQAVLTNDLPRRAIIIGTFDTIYFLLLALSRAGRTRIGSILNIFFLVTFTLALTVRNGGITAPAIGVLVLIVLIASLLLGDGAAVATGIACGLGGLGLVLAEIYGILPPSSATRHPINIWLGNCAVLFMAIGLQRLARRRLEDALDRERLAAAELQKRQAEFRAIFENAPVGITLVDQDGRIVKCNPAMARLTGYAAGDLEAVAISEITHPDDRQASLEIYRALWAGERSTYEIEKRYIGKDGEIVWGRLTGFLIEDAAKLFRLGVGMIENVTARKKAEEEKQTLEAQLAQAQKMEAIGHLAGGVAHDFNNLLTVIQGYSSMIQAKLPEGDPTQAMLQEIRLASERAASLTRQLLAFSRKTVLEPRVLDVNDLIGNLERMLLRLIGEDVQLTTVLRPSLGRVRADPALLEQAIVNLAVNARDAMPHGGKLTIATQDAELDEHYAAANPEVSPGRYILVSVSDTGTGIDESIRSHLFEPFFTTKGVGEGTGLGLAMVYGFTKQSGGHVTVYSAPGMGATFKLYLPRIEQEDSAAKMEPQPAQPAPTFSADETILLVEDEPGVRHLAKEVLEQSGYTVLEAAFPREAIQIAQQHRGTIHLLVTDVVMPEMNGGQVATAIGSLHPEAKVLFLSGYADDVVVRHGVLDASANFLQKPFSPRRLTARVREVLDG